MKCSRCNKVMAERHIVDHEYYCSRECAIAAITDDIILNAKERATEYYGECVEVEPADITRCTKCNRPLALNETAWSSIDGMYCSRSCGVGDAYNKYSPDEYRNEDEHISKATRYFEDTAEEITREEYGVTIERASEYSKEYDKTFIFERIYEANTIISIELLGWYYGEPNAKSDEAFVRKYKATYVE